jgi:sec-independent protein translocase protein TatC
MATDPEDPRTDQMPEEEGGPVKSFLDHLEDLRWVLIKTIAAIGVGMLICLIAGDRVVNILKYPMTQAKITFPGTNQVWIVSWGTNRLGVYKLNDEQQRKFSVGSTQFVALKVELIPTGTNMLVSLALDPDTDPAVARQMRMDLQNLGPVSAFFVSLQIALYGGLVLASPFVFYFVAGFIFPALRMREKHYVYRGLGFGLSLFVVGISFCYFVLMPVALRASVAYSNWLGFAANQWRAEEYISFVCKFMIGMGIGFQMPVVLLTLVKIGVLSYTVLRKMWRYMIVINLVLGALLTTPEVVTQVLMAVPLYLLYEISVWVAWYWEWRDRKHALAQKKTEEDERRRRAEGGATPGA